MNTTKMMIGALAALSCGLLLMAAVPQQEPEKPEAMSYRDRCAEWIGKGFTTGGARTSMRRKDDGSYTLVAVGKDYAEFQHDQLRLFIPLAALTVIGLK